ncbi:kidins220b [Symbiodinium sp. CCMP2592]|nr:kidins220b [Symbiodinium sp. CCMP2592]
MDVAGRQKQHAEFLFIRDKKLIRVFAASGFEMASIPSDVLTDVRSLKKQLHGICGFPRFRQRLLYNASILQDQTKLDSEMDLQLVTLPFAPVPMVDQMKPYLATDSGDLEQLEEFLQRPIDPNLHTFGDQGGLTLLLYAAYKGGLEAAEMLLEAGADPNLPGGPNMDTPLGVACCAGDEKMIRLLMNAGADSDQVCGRFGETPRSIVSDKGHTKLLHLF